MEDPQKPAFLLKCMMDHMSDMIYFKDRDSKFIMMNKAAAKWQGGCGPEALVGKSDFDFYSEEDDLLMASQLQKTFFPTSYPFFPASADSA